MVVTTTTVTTDVPWQDITPDLPWFWSYFDKKLGSCWKLSCPSENRNASEPFVVITTPSE